ncbi:MULTISPECIES: class II SORL domain-containing protein [unclassified Thermotoga]|uniref:class II SORL domain-containing protein n=1 Tax=unclassified Thermotoga TaxID=2631113 RepID=UPI000280E731|nr:MULTISPECIES: class II SORL domain-containing protein [unclassified Thermotoga]AIY85825.1 Superoxide reductase [Thermotoga sp. 2812B]EJX26888.1 Superoxide reductase [Thermotoga sp. EMP]
MKISDFIKTEDFKKEKHVPVIEAPEKVKKDDKVQITVTVGKEIPHPNTTEHHIRWIKVFFQPDGDPYVYEVGRYEFNAHGESVQGPNTGAVYTEPAVTTVVKLNRSGTIIALSYCNIHGLWESSKKITVEE